MKHNIWKINAHLNTVSATRSGMEWTMMAVISAGKEKKSRAR
jgi:hypothetical protein